MLLRRFIYVPDQLAANPPIIVAMHYCTGTAQAYFQGTQYANLANSKGFIVIVRPLFLFLTASSTLFECTLTQNPLQYPDAPDSGGCWDVHSDATLTHDAGGDSLGIASMVRYTIDQYGADPSRVFATGTSSGAMMTNVRTSWL